MIEGKAETIIEAVELIAQAVHSAARELGNGGAATPMGALEAHGAVIKEAGEDIASALRSVADAIVQVATEMEFTRLEK